MLAGCVSGPAPNNLLTSIYAPQQMTGEQDGHPEGDWITAAPVSRGAPTCDWQVPRELDTYRRAPISEFASQTAPLAPGDRLSIRVLGDSDSLSGTYVVDSDGSVRLRGIAPTRAGGGSLEDLQEALRVRLVGAGIVKPLRNAVSVSLIESAGVSVSVHGAVFESQAVRAGERTPESRIGLKEGDVSGDANVSRSVATAIRAAGGVRPDADVQRIYLIRDRAYVELDLSGLVHGWAATDIAVSAGDRIIVPSRKCFDAKLARPTPLTPPGIRVYMSNLTRSANNNAGAAIGKETTSLPYGTRFLQALVAANCVGGSFMQSDRRAVLISRNPINGQSVVVERDIEKLVREANRDAFDPYLMPGDAIACYDSRWTNLAEAIGMVSQGVSTVTPAILLDNAL
ncbi:polysaccharide biosynthesis/export family protein [Qipengyuania aquimaris]|uniref:polysaccharide biosynthesis/export family protein n=1 Tax=Qipengyuania aquimaris TaxID=255984 RepID=UPI001C93CE3D|nr:polysaccharide biosynthesis/export family protein [Qipengyuania aquimaris]MBY6127763.1 polysaccharide biosynthesis/export family protein [Qipengyuania aquimaris]